MINLANKTILVTGGTGSFGKSFIKTLLKDSTIKKIIVFSRDECKQHHMEQEIMDSRVRFFIGDVRDLERLRRAFSTVDVVVHAAALKHVPILEYNPMEAIKTNIIGSQNVIEAAIDCGVQKVIFISTDKAAQPVNLYGSTKLCAEKLFVAANSYTAGKSVFSVVRYGNVLGSRGSIVDVIMRDKTLKIIKITDINMTRFWITLKEAHELVLFALEHMEGGEIFIPKAPSMKVIDLVDCISPDTEREIVGIRPGEKVHEVLLTEEESKNTIDIKKYFIVLPHFPYWSSSLYQKHVEMGDKIIKPFVFSSESNDKWLVAEKLLEMLLQE